MLPILYTLYTLVTSSPGGRDGGMFTRGCISRLGKALMGTIVSWWGLGHHEPDTYVIPYHHPMDRDFPGED